MITSRSLAYLLHTNPTYVARRFAQAVAAPRAKESWRADFRNSYPKPGDNPFDDPLWTRTTWHLWGKRIITILFFGVLADFRFVPDWQNGLKEKDPYTIRMLNYFFPNLEPWYMQADE